MGKATGMFITFLILLMFIWSIVLFFKGQWTDGIMMLGICFALQQAGNSHTEATWARHRADWIIRRMSEKEQQEEKEEHKRQLNELMDIAGEIQQGGLRRAPGPPPL